MGMDMELADGKRDALGELDALRRHRCRARALFISATFDGSAKLLEDNRLRKNLAVMLTLAHRASESWYVTRASDPGNDRLHQARPIAPPDLPQDACAALAPIALRATSVELAQHDVGVPGSLLRVSMLSSADDRHSAMRESAQTRGKLDVREAHDGLHEETGAEVRRQHSDRQTVGPQRGTHLDERLELAQRDRYMCTSQRVYDVLVVRGDGRRILGRGVTVLLLLPLNGHCGHEVLRFAVSADCRVPQGYKLGQTEHGLGQTGHGRVVHFLDDVPRRFFDVEQLNRQSQAGFRSRDRQPGTPRAELGCSDDYGNVDLTHSMQLSGAAT